MSKDLQIIPKDTIILFSSGEYSNYSVHGLHKAMANIDPDQLRNEWVSLHPEQMETYHFKQDEFIAFLLDKGLITTVPGPNWMEWYLSSYSSIKEMRVYKGPILFN